MKKLATLFLVILMVAPFFAPQTKAEYDESHIGYVIIPAISMFRAIYPARIVDRHYDDEALAGRVVWLDGTSWIDDVDWGRLVLAGHSYGVFRYIDQLEYNDEIIVLGPNNAAIYRVRWKKVVGTEEWNYLAPTDTATLLLITCSDEKRLIISADRIR